MGMNSINRKLGMILLAAVLISSVQCNPDFNKKKELLIGDWILISGQWHPGFRLTQDSIFPMIEQINLSGLSVMQHYGEPYELTKDDSLIFGPSDHIENKWGLNKALRGFWKINKLTGDSLIVEDHRGIMSFYKKSK